MADAFDSVTDAMSDAVERLNDYAAVWESAAARNAAGAYKAEDWLVDAEALLLMAVKDSAKLWAATVDAWAKAMPKTTDGDSTS